MNMKTLTKAEEEIMQLLWKLKEANVSAIIAEMEEPKPAYNTVSTIVRILEKKRFVDYKKKGRGHYYFPLISKEQYSTYSVSKLKNSYFDGSLKNMVSFFIKKNEMSLNDLEEVLNELDKKNKS